MIITKSQNIPNIYMQKGIVQRVYDDCLKENKMIITKEEMGINYLMKATHGEWEFTQMYSKNIPLDRIESHFNIEATIRYEKFLGDTSV